jgi:elongation factor 1-gamma
MQAVAALSGLEVVMDPDFVMRETNRTPEFLAKFPLGKVPAFEGADGFCVAEGQAICRYIADSGNNSAQLLGADARARAKVEEWACFAEAEITAHVLPPMLMTMFRLIPFDEARFNQCAADLERALRRVDVALQQGQRFLMGGDKITLADVMVGGVLLLAGKFLMDREMREKAAPNVERYLKGLMEIPEMKGAFGEIELCESRLKA